MLERSVQSRTRINAPSLDVWRTLCDVDAYAYWNPFLVEVRGRPAPGAALAVSLRLGDGRALAAQSPALQERVRRPLVLRAQVARHESPRVSCWEGAAWGGLCRYAFRFDLAHMDKHTTECTATVAVSGPLAPLAALLWTRDAVRNLRRMTDMLRAVCEAR